MLRILGDNFSFDLVNQSNLTQIYWSHLFGWIVFSPKAKLTEKSSNLDCQEETLLILYWLHDLQFQCSLLDLVLMRSITQKCIKRIRWIKIFEIRTC